MARAGAWTRKYPGEAFSMDEHPANAREARGSRLIRGKNGIPMDGHPPRKDLMGGSVLGSRGVLCDGEKMMFPMIAAPQAPELVRGTT